MKNKISSVLLLCLLSSQLMANSSISLLCEDKYTTTTIQSTGKPISVNGRESTGNTKFKIEINTPKKGKSYIATKTDRQEIIYIGRGGMDTFYFIEQTPIGNINLYSLFSDGTLTISKSYDVLGLSKMNVQSIYQCK